MLVISHFTINRTIIVNEETIFISMEAMFVLLLIIIMIIINQIFIQDNLPAQKSTVIIRVLFLKV